MWWKGRLKELERSYGQASEFYERVYEKQPTIDRLNRLARYDVVILARLLTSSRSVLSTLLFSAQNTKIQ